MLLECVSEVVYLKAYHCLFVSHVVCSGLVCFLFFFWGEGKERDFRSLLVSMGRSEPEKYPPVQERRKGMYMYVLQKLSTIQ